MKIKVTQAHIDAAVFAARENEAASVCDICPVAQALRELVHPDIQVGAHEIWINWDQTQGDIWRLGESASYFTEASQQDWQNLKPRTIAIKGA